MKSNSAFKRLHAEYHRLSKDPIPYLTAQPIPSSLLEWRYVVRGPADTPYEGGIYQGKIVFPVEYPYKPPSRSNKMKNSTIGSIECFFLRHLHVNTQWTIQNEYKFMFNHYIISSGFMESFMVIDRD